MDVTRASPSPGPLPANTHKGPRGGTTASGTHRTQKKKPEAALKREKDSQRGLFTWRALGSLSLPVRGEGSSRRTS